MAGRAFASGLASIQRIKRGGNGGPGAKYRVVMFHAYPQELLRGWLRAHSIADDQVRALAVRWAFVGFCWGICIALGFRGMLLGDLRQCVSLGAPAG